TPLGSPPARRRSTPRLRRFIGRCCESRTTQRRNAQTGRQGDKETRRVVRTRYKPTAFSCFLTVSLSPCLPVLSGNDLDREAKVEGAERHAKRIGELNGEAQR